MINKFTQRMADSIYSKQQAKRVILCGLLDNYLIPPLKRAAPESRAMSPWDSKGMSEDDAREIQKEARRKPAPLSSVLFVEKTPGGIYLN